MTIYITNLVKPWQHVPVSITVPVAEFNANSRRLRPESHGFDWYHYSVGYYGDSGYVELKRVNHLEQLGVANGQ